MTEALTLDDFETLAREQLPHSTFEFIASGAGDEITLRWNREAFQRIALRPRVLEDVSRIDTHVKLLGEELPFPILLAPVAYQRLIHPEGEIAAARGAAQADATYVVSTASNCAIGEIASAAKCRLWLQIYLQSDRAETRELVQRAEAAGVRALCLTVDTPVLGTRNRQARAKFALPPDLPTPHLDPIGRDRLSVVSATREPITWADVEWLRSITRLPLLLKGILDDDDAERGIEHGAAGVIVSNHGARNLDTVPATIEALPPIVERVGGRVPILIDGGIRRGTDVVKALALGAAAVLIGRPYAYALAVAGTEGVARRGHSPRRARDINGAARSLVNRINRSVSFVVSAEESAGLNLLLLLGVTSCRLATIRIRAALLHRGITAGTCQRNRQRVGEHRCGDLLRSPRATVSSRALMRRAPWSGSLSGRRRAKRPPLHKALPDAVNVIGVRRRLAALPNQRSNLAAVVSAMKHDVHQHVFCSTAPVLPFRIDIVDDRMEIGDRQHALPLLVEACELLVASAEIPVGPDDRRLRLIPQSTDPEPLGANDVRQDRERTRGRSGKRP